MAATSAALHALHARLGDDGARSAYWSALARFLRFELSKSDFDRLALKALGPHVALHNAVIMALLQDAQQADGAAGADASGLQLFGRPEVASAAGATGAASGAAGLHAGAAGAAGAAPVQQAGPKLMLKIRQGPGGMDASAQMHGVRVDPVEEAQLNALHERLLPLAQQHGLQVRWRWRWLAASYRRDPAACRPMPPLRRPRKTAHACAAAMRAFACAPLDRACSPRR